MTREDDTMDIGEKDLPQKFILKVLGHCPTSGLWGLKHTRDPVDKMVSFAKDNKLCLPIVRLVVTREGIFLLPLDGKGRPEDDESEVRINVTIPKSEVECVRTGEGDESKTSRHCFRIKAHFRIVKRIDRRKAKKKLEEVLSDGKGDGMCKGCGRTQAGHETPLPTNAELLEKYKRIDWNRRGIHFYPIDNISYGVQDLVYTRVFSMIEVTEPRRALRAPFVCHSFVCESHNTAKQLTHALDAAFQAYGKILKDGQKDREVRSPQRPAPPAL